jgi:hypothetical protein
MREKEERAQFPKMLRLYGRAILLSKESQWLKPFLAPARLKE